MSGETADTECRACEMPASGHHSLPVDNDGEIVNSDYAGEWAGVPACKGCHDVHAAAGVVGLAAHVKATEELRGIVRLAVADLQDAADGLRRSTNDFTDALRLLP